MMSDQLAQIREWLEGCDRLITCKNDIDHVKHHAKRCLDLLDEYEHRLVVLEGVEEAYATFDGGDNVEGFDCHGNLCEWLVGDGYVKLDAGCSLYFRASDLRGFLAQGIAALMFLESK